LSDRKFEVAISFAGEQRDYASKLARQLQARGVSVFYDEFYVPELWGKNLAEEFHRIYSKDANFALMLISKEYVEKNWTRHERRAAIERALSERAEYILPIRFDDSWPDGISTATAYLAADRFSAGAVAEILFKKLGIDPLKGKASHVAPPQISSLVADVGFDYTSFNGHYVIGEGETSFETVWSTGGGNRIHAYNDGSNVQGIAIAAGAKSLEDIKDASIYDFTSRTRTPSVGEYLIVRNNGGFYAAIKLVEVRTKGFNATDHYVKIFYVIQRDKSTDFSDYSVLE
jgi:hypothetical protein